MAMRQRKINVRSQQGMTLIMLVFIVGMMMTAYLLYALDSNAVKIERDKKTAAALAEAKAALIGRSVMDINRPGSLPCPDSNGDGSADMFTGPGNECPSYLGRFPWKTLGTGELGDGYGESLWYALSSNYRDDSSVQPLNGTSAGFLKVDGVGDMVAIVFSPGPPIGPQAGRPSNNVADYLEGENSDGDMDYSNILSQVQNDRLLSISRGELISVVSLRVLGEIRVGLRNYYADSNKFPYAAPINNGDQGAPPIPPLTPYLPYNDLDFNSVTETMLKDNDWFPLVGYAVAPNLKSASIMLNGKTMGVTP